MCSNFVQEVVFARVIVLRVVSGRPASCVAIELEAWKCRAGRHALSHVIMSHMTSSHRWAGVRGARESGNYFLTTKSNTGIQGTLWLVCGENEIEEM